MSKFSALSLLFVAAGVACAQSPGFRAVHVQAEKATSGKDKISRKSIGRVEAVRTVNVRSAVAGFVLKPEFAEGSFVQEGDVLFRIHPVRYEAAVKQCEASLAELTAKIVYAENNYKRLKELAAREAASKEDMETAQADLEALKAQIAGAQADLVKARKDLDDCTIRAEITGRVGRRSVSEGSYVAEGEELVTITQLDPIYVRFPLSQSDVNGIFEGVRRVKDVATVRMTTADGQRYPGAGSIAIVDNQLTANTDTYTLWASFENKNHTLTPDGVGALYVSRVDTEEVTKVPLTAVQHDATGDFVFTIADDGTVARREVVSGSIQGRMQTIYSGLQPGETVITDGSHKTRAGDKVIPVFPETSTADAANADAARPAAEEAPIASKVAAVTLAQDPTILTCQGARIEAINSVSLRPLVQGLLAEPNFKEGDMVQHENILFQIEPTRYQAVVDSQKAKIAQLDVSIANARRKYERQQYLMERSSTSRDNLESAKATLDQLIAQRDSAAAALVVAEDDLSRCTVRAPMTARVGRVNYSKGNYITDINSSLATIVQISPIYVRFSLSENSILSTYGCDEKLLSQARVTLVTATGTTFEESASAIFANNVIAQATDTQDFWATFPNEKRELQPGGSVTIKVARKPEYKVPAVPADAIQTDTRGAYVYKLENGHAVQTRVLRGSATEDGRIVVFSGLAEGDQVLTTNLADMEDGSPVKPE